MRSIVNEEQELRIYAGISTGKLHGSRVAGGTFFIIPFTSSVPPSSTLIDFRPLSQEEGLKEEEEEEEEEEDVIVAKEREGGESSGGRKLQCGNNNKAHITTGASIAS